MIFLCTLWRSSQLVKNIASNFSIRRNLFPQIGICKFTTFKALEYPRRKFNPNPFGVPSWANYDGNQKCIDGDEDTSKLIWEGYKRNYKGQKPPQKTRARCRRGEKLCSNPCPVCASAETVKYTNTSLLSQFICPYSGRILPASKTGLCQLQQKKMEAAIEVARDYGLLPIIMPRKLPKEELRTPPWNRVDIIS